MLVLVTSCGRPDRAVTRAFYFWKSTVALSPTDCAALDSLGVSRMYVRLFDVQWNDQRAEAVPAGVAHIAGRWPSELELVPTVFITNQSVRNVAPDALRRQRLAQHVVEKIAAVLDAWRAAGAFLGSRYDAPSGVLPALSEVQIDCDWTQSTRGAYFDLLEQIRRRLRVHNPRLRLSATVRLHQIRYRQAAGVPPVDRGMLMAYNVGDVTQPDTANSIVDAAEIDRYLGSLGSYPLPLDVALPIFSWGAVFHYGNFAVLIDGLRTDDLDRLPEVRRVRPHTYLVERDVIIRGHSVFAGDTIRIESSDSAACLSVARSIARRLDADSLVVCLYHFDSTNLAHHDRQELSALYRTLH